VPAPKLEVALLLGVIHLVVKSHFHTVNQLLARNQGGLVSVEEKPLNEEEQKRRRKKRERERMRMRTRNKERGKRSSG
jgi:hypothetical protein